jgi:hypothetical protein
LSFDEQDALAEAAGHREHHIVPCGGRRQGKKRRRGNNEISQQESFGDNIGNLVRLLSDVLRSYIVS